MADVDLGGLERPGPVLAQVDGEQAVRRLAREARDEAHRLLGERPCPLVVEEAAAVDVAGHARDCKMPHEVLQPLVAARLEQLVLVEQKRAGDVPSRQVLGDHVARDLRIEIGPGVCLLGLGHLERADPAGRSVGVVAEPDGASVQVEPAPLEQVVSTRDAIPRHEPRLTQRLVQLPLADRDRHEARRR